MFIGLPRCAPPPQEGKHGPKRPQYAKGALNLLRFMSRFLCGKGSKYHARCSGKMLLIKRSFMNE